MLMRVGLERANSRNQDSGALISMCMGVFLNDYTSHPTAVIDILFLRAGGEKGCCPLLASSLTMQKPLPEVLSH